MIRLHFVVDGERDFVTLPRLVEAIIQRDVAETTGKWARLRGKGYGKKLMFATLQAKDIGARGLVATVDSDRSDGRYLPSLREGREAVRQRHAVLPTALGEAIPHAEAWLLDDRVAVQQSLDLPRDTQVPNVRHVDYPKSELELLIAQSIHAQDRDNALRRLARSVQPSRCAHAKETGFRAFHREVKDEIVPLLNESNPRTGSINAGSS